MKDFNEKVSDFLWYLAAFIACLIFVIWLIKVEKPRRELSLDLTYENLVIKN